MTSVLFFLLYIITPFRGDYCVTYCQREGCPHQREKGGVGALGLERPDDGEHSDRHYVAIDHSSDGEAPAFPPHSGGDNELKRVEPEQEHVGRRGIVRRHEDEECYQEPDDSEDAEPDGEKRGEDAFLHDHSGAGDEQGGSREPACEQRRLPPWRGAEGGVGDSFVEHDCLAHQRAAVGEVGAGRLFHHLERHEHLLAGADRDVDAGAEAEVDAELIPGIVAVVLAHFAAEGAVFHRIGPDHCLAGAAVDVVDDARGAVVEHVVVAVGGVLGKRLLLQERGEFARLGLGEVEALLHYLPACLDIFRHEPGEGIAGEHIVGLTLQETVYEIGRREVEGAVIVDQVVFAVLHPQSLVAAELIDLRAGPAGDEADNDGIPFLLRAEGGQEKQDCQQGRDYFS